MHKPASRLAVLVASGFAMIAGATCADSSPTGPGRSALRAVVGFAPAFSAAVADIYRSLAAFQLQVDNVHLLLKHQDGATAKDTVIALAPGQDSLSIELSVDIEGQEELLLAIVELRDGEDVMFSGTQAIRAKRGGLPDGVPSQIPILYVGPGAAATDLVLSPSDTTMLGGGTDSLALRASATDASGEPVSDLAISWSVKDAGLGTVSIEGVFRPSAIRGSTYVIARLPTGVSDSARITLVPLPSQLALVSGDGQTGVAGRVLGQPIVVEVRGSDNLPIPGAVVHFAVTAGGGSISPGSAVADAGGRATAAFTLGSVAGTNTVQASIGDLTPLVISATGQPTGPGALQFKIAPGASAKAGVPLAQQPIIQVRDSLGNLLSTTGLQVQASIVGDGHSLGGTTTATTDAAGKATFSNLQINGLVGSAQIRFLLVNTSIEIASASIVVTAGNASALALAQQPSGSALSGVPLMTQPHVHLHDAYGNDVAAAGIPVTAGLIVAEGRTLGGTLTVNTNASGVAQFSGLSISGPPGTTRLTFADPDSLASALSNEITLTAGTAATLMAVTSLAYGDSAGANVQAMFLPSVSVRDASNNPVPGVEVKFRRHGGAGASINGQPDTLVLLTTDAGGNAALTSRRLQTVVGIDTVLVTAAGLTDTLAFVAAVTNGLAAQLQFLVQPANSLGGEPTGALVQLLDQYGNAAVSGPSSTLNITLALSGGTAGAVLSGTLTQAAVGGVTTFSNISVDLVGTGYTLLASTATIAGVSSTAFDVTVGPAAVVAMLSGDGQGALAGESLALPLVARATDLGGNPVPGATITFSVDSGGGSLTSPQVADAEGLASVGWVVGIGQQLVTATVGTTPVPFRAYIAERVVLITEPPLTPQSGVLFTTAPRAQLTDSAGHVVRRAGVVIVTALPPVGGGPFLTGSSGDGTDADGIAVFEGLAITGPATAGLRMEFYLIDGLELPYPGVGRDSSSVIDIQAGLPQEIISSDLEEHHLFDTPGTRTVSVRVTDGYNNVPGAPVLYAMETGATCALTSPSSTTTDASGVSSITVNIQGSPASCAVSAELGGLGPEPPQVIHRLYVAPTGMLVWTGAQDSGWDITPNWFGGPPVSTSDVFVPRAATFASWPSITASTSIHLLVIESEALLNLDKDTLTLDHSLTADGIVNGANNATVQLIGGSSNPTVRGTVNALLMIGDPRCASSAQYATSGLLRADSLQIDCRLDMNEAFDVDVKGWVRVASSGRLTLNKGRVLAHGRTFLDGRVDIADGILSSDGDLFVSDTGTVDQRGGSIVVGGDATFNGFASLSAGTLDLARNFFHTGNGDNLVLVGALPHVTRFVASSATADTLRISWEAASGSPSQFGQLEFNTRGQTVVTLFRTTGDAIVRADNVIVNSDAKLLIPDTRYGISTTGIKGFGFQLIAGGQLDNRGAVNVPLMVGCVPLGLLVDALSCLTP